MTKLEQLIEQLCPDGVEYETMGKYFPFIRNGFVGTVTKYFSDEEHGVRYLEGKNIHNGIISDNEELYVTKEFHQKHIRNELQPDDIVMVQSGHVGECAVVGKKYAGANCHALIIMSNGGKINSRYVVYYFQSVEGKKKLDKTTTGGTIKHILASGMKKVTIPVPPLEVQDEIVRILDTFTELTTELITELTNRKKQYEYYRGKLLCFESNIPKKKLGETCILKAGNSISSFEISEIKNDISSVPCYGGNGIRGYVKTANKHGNYPLIGRQGALCGNVQYAKGDFYATEHAVVVNSEKAYIPRFLFHLLIHMNLNQYKSAGAQPGLSVKNLQEISAPVPPIKEQQRIVSILDRFDKLCNDISEGLPAEIEARQKQYEYYRDKLLTFKERSV